MGRRKKGLKTKRKAKKFYEEIGWTVDDVEASYRYAKSKDLFGLFDLIAIKERSIVFIQVKTNRPATQKEYKKWAKEHCCENIYCEVYTWYDNNGPRIQHYREDGSIIDVDLRMRKNEGKRVYNDMEIVMERIVI